MLKKLAFIVLLTLVSQFLKAQNEFITVWKPSNVLPQPYQGIVENSNDTEIWLPTEGTNYTIYWEEIGYPSHNSTLTNVNSAYQKLLFFGQPLNPIPNNATYRVKISNGNGIFHRIRFADWDLYTNGNGIIGDAHKIIKVEQWGNIDWSSMKQAFQACINLDVTATDIPKLDNVNSLSYMFALCANLVGNSTINNWDISNVTSLDGTFLGNTIFNQPLYNWDTSNVTIMQGTFSGAKAYNQPLSSWNTANVTTTGSMFLSAFSFNQPIGNWNISNNTNTTFMFSYANQFNQPLNNWNTSKVTRMDYMFLGATSFNQNIANWDTGKVVEMPAMFSGATSFNQSLATWNLNMLQNAGMMFMNSGLNCQNYDSTLYGWSQNPVTPNNINISPASPLVYSSALAVAARTHLIADKNWIISGDIYDNSCQSVLSTSESSSKNEINLYPNPATDFMYVKNLKGSNSYKISDASGRIILQDILNEEKIDVSSLMKGNYILQIISKDKIQSFKFIKK
jgi:surface protein